MTGNRSGKRGTWLAKVVAVVALVALGDWMFFQHLLYAGYFGVFGLALVAAAVLVRPAVRRDRRALGAATLAAAYAVAMMWNGSLAAFLLFWIAIGLAIILPQRSRFGDARQWALTLPVHAVIALAGPMIDLRKLARVRARRNRTGRSPRNFGIDAFLLPAVGSAVFVALFAMANPMFARLLGAISTPRFDLLWLVRALLWTVLAIVGLGVLRPRLTGLTARSMNGSDDRSARPSSLPLASLVASLIAFNAVFAVQNVMDLAWLWGLAPLPADMTLAEYAHRGAYPLIVTALLAAVFVLVTLRPGLASAAVPMVRRLVALWIAQNVILVASAMLRTIDYIAAYSLTELRIAALAWMALVATGLVLIGWRLLRDRTADWLINANTLAALVVLSGFAVVDIGAVAARWNVAHARELGGSGERLDLCYLRQLEGSALLSLIALEQRPLPGDLAERVTAVRQDVYARFRNETAHGGWTILGAQRRRAATALLGDQAMAPIAAIARDCDGRRAALSTQPDPAALTAAPKR